MAATLAVGEKRSRSSGKDERWRRPREVRKLTLGVKTLRRLPILEEPVDQARPERRGDCVGAVRPCPWVGCRYHLYLDVMKRGAITLNFPDLEPEELAVSCALDVADRGGQLQETVGGAMNLTRERVRQIERAVLDRAEFVGALEGWRGHVPGLEVRPSPLEEVANESG